MTTCSSYMSEFLWFNNEKATIDVIDETSDILILTILREACEVDRWKAGFFNVVQDLKLRYPNKKICLIINSFFTPYLKELNLTSVDDVVTIDFFLMLVYDRLFNKNESTPAPQWNSTSNKFLFLTGKIAKPQRIRLLYKLYKQSLLERAEWSLYPPNNDSERDFIKTELLPELTSEEVDNFIQQHLRNPDQADVTNLGINFHYSGIPFSTELYDNCSFQVISETAIYDHDIGLDAWITEKGWLPIVNRRPFIVAGSIGYLEKLKRLGFKTFENYLLHPNYNEINDYDMRLDAVVDNTRYWLTTIHAQADEINKDVEHNYRRFIELAHENFEKMNNFITRHNITNATIDNVLTLRDEMSHARWKSWYGRIKDPGWPACDLEEDFFKLPDWIQKECIEVFNYKPKEEQ